MEDNKISTLIKDSLGSIRELVDANTVIGTPISAGSVTIIPISKVSVGFVGGGNDYVGKNAEKTGKSNFGGAGGTGMTVNPVGFIVVHEDGKTEMMSVDAPSNGNDLSQSVDTIVQKAPEIIEKIKAIFKKKKATSEEVEEDEIVKAEESEEIED